MGRLRIPALAGAACALALAGCSTGGGAFPDDPVTVYVSLPLRGPAWIDGRDAADGVRLALADANGMAGEREVRAVFLDDTEGPGAQARWTPARSAANARAATEDASAIAYIGDFESGATRSSLPITNEARMLQVSPASSAMDLVTEPGTFDDVPEDAQPSGHRTFGRVIPDDEAQAAAAAGWVERLRVHRVATQSDGSRFGDEMVMAFAEALDSAAVSDRADFVYFGGELDREPAALTKGLPVGHFMVSDAELVPPAVRTQPPGTLATSAAIDPSQLPPAGREFARRFRQRFGREPGRYAAYGYEAMAVVLDSIERAGGEGGDRQAVIDAFFDTADRDSVLGTYSVTDLGETTLDRMTGYRISAGQPEPVVELRAPG